MVVASFQPLMPEPRALGSLLSSAAELIAEGHRLEAAGTHLSCTLSPWLRAMNSDDTNKIEGQHTRPADIERALHQHFDADEPSDCGVLEAETSRAKVHFAVPFKSLRFLFPRL